MVNFEMNRGGNVGKTGFAVFFQPVYLKGLFVFLFVLYSSAVYAKPVAYDVVINAPESVKKTAAGCSHSVRNCKKSAVAVWCLIWAHIFKKSHKKSLISAIRLIFH